MTQERSVGSVEELRAIIGEPHPVTHHKILTELDDLSAAFVRRSPFLLLATVDADGRPDVSPRGDQPGFVTVEDARTLWIPERKGNRLAFGLQNILASPEAALLFIVPGTEETLRVHGAAELLARGQPAALGIRVRVRRCFFQCARAFKRSRLWDAAAWPAPQAFSFGSVIAAQMGQGEDLVREIDARVEAGYRNDL